MYYELPSPRGLEETEEPVVPDEPTFPDLAASAFRQENLPVNFYNWVTRPEFKADPTYNPFKDEANAGYQLHEGFINLRSPDEATLFRTQVDQETEDRYKLASGGWQAGVATIGAGLLGPEALIPFFGPAQKAWKTAQITEGAAIGGATVGAIEVGREAVLHQAQETRTTQESVENSVGAVIVGSVLGSILGGFKTTADLARTSRQVEQHVFGESTGAAKVGTTFEEEELTGSLGLGKIHGKLKLSPSAWFAQSSTAAGRQMGRRLAEDDFLREMNVEGVPTDISAETYRKLAEGEIAGVIDYTNDQFKAYKQAGGVMTRSQFNETVTDAMRAGDIHEIPQVASVAKRARELVDKRTGEAVDAKMLNEKYLDKDQYGKYVHRVWDRGVVKARRLELEDIITSYLVRGEKSRIVKDPDYTPLDEPEIRQVASDTVDLILYGDDIQGLAGVRLGDFAATTASPLQARTLNIPDELVKDFLENDFEEVLTKYNRQMSADLALNRVFGETSLKDTWTGVRDEYNMLIRDAHAKGDTKLAAKLQKELEQAREYGTALRDRIRGTYGMPNNPEDIWYRTGRAFRTLNYLRMLGGMAISSIPDLGSIVIKNGMPKTLNMLGKLVTTPEFRNLSKVEMRNAAIGLDMTLAGRAKAMANLMDPYAGKTKLERGLSWMEEGFGKVTLMNQWNTAMKQWAGAATQSNMIKAINKVKAGKASKADIERLAKSGISKEDASRMADEIAEFGDGDLSGADMWRDPDLAVNFRAAILKQVDSTIVTPGVGDTPLWMSSSFGKLLGQFKTFAAAVVNRVTIPALQKRDAATVNGTILMLSLGYMAYALKQQIAGREVSTDPDVIARESLDRSGILGVYTELANMTAKVTGVGGTSRYASRNFMGSLAGPTFGTGQDASEVIYQLSQGEWDAATAEKALKLAPYQNLFYLRYLYENHYQEN